MSVNVVEGNRKRVQAYEGVVIAKRNRGLNSGFTVRKISSGEGVERTFQTYSPLIAGIEVKRRGDVRRAKLYYLRDRSGKSARIKGKSCLRASRLLPPPLKAQASPDTQTATVPQPVAVFFSDVPRGLPSQSFGEPPGSLSRPPARFCQPTRPHRESPALQIVLRQRRPRPCRI